MKQTIRSLKHIRRAAYALLKRRVPGQLVIQFTDRCNALCPQCGMRTRETFSRSKLSLSEVKRILDRAARRNVSLASFTGGDHFLYLDELALLIQRAGDLGIPYIRTGTNGFLFMNDFFFINAKEAQTFPCGYRGEEKSGLYGDPDWTPPPEGEACTRCDWECFRDPSELFGPLLQALSNPVGLFRKFTQEPFLRRLWVEDLRYCRACAYFDGRRPPNFRRLGAFQGKHPAIPFLPLE